MTKASTPPAETGRALPASDRSNIKLALALALFAVAAIIAYVQWPATPSPGTELPPDPVAPNAGASAANATPSRVTYRQTDRGTTVVEDGEVTVERAGGGLVAPGCDPN